MRCTAKYQIDVTIPDHNVKKSANKEKFLSDILTTTGTKEEIKEAVSKHIDLIVDKLHELYYGEGE
ncbi:unnamed protein product [marine sediment metagenome]|uniref:Uncharacterized protein n=1 Tax=marine sediment metagenome TaxID=412755 RepID=X0UTN0_9ZZZZ